MWPPGSTAIPNIQLLPWRCQAQMQKLSTVATGMNLKPTATVREIDQLLIEYSDLINPSFKAWYCKRFSALGIDNVHKYASQARADGRQPSKLFSFLIK